MPYGTKRGIRTPGEFSFFDYIGLSIAGATGIVSALIVDYYQKGEASAIYTINQWAVTSARMVGLEMVPLYVVVLAIVGVGAGSIFYFQPITRQGAFAQGFGLLAVLMTAVPADLAGGLEAMSDDLALPPATSAAALAAPAGGLIHRADIRAAEAQPSIVRVQNNRADAAFDVSLRITFEGGAPDNLEQMIRRGTIRGRLHNPATGRTYNLFRSAGGTIKKLGDAIVIRAGIPTDVGDGTLWVRVEAAGFVIEQQSAAVSTDDPLVWTVNMQRSSTPLFIQRLNQSYWFN